MSKKDKENSKILENIHSLKVADLLKTVGDEGSEKNFSINFFNNIFIIFSKLLSTIYF